MMIIRFTHAVAVLLALAFRVSAQSGSNEPIGRLGLDISGIETPKLASPAASATPAPRPDKRPKGPTEITSREATFDNRNHLATFTTEVLLRDPEFGLSSDRLTVYLKKPPAQGAAKPEPKPKAAGDQGQGSGIEKAIAEGHVIITQDKVDLDGKPQRYTAKAKRAVFDNTTGTLKLYGWPEISQSISGNLSKQTVAKEESTIITLDRAGKIIVDGYSTSRLMDASDLNQNPR
jgi:lipopolysaccharide export system protein LptA